MRKALPLALMGAYFVFRPGFALAGMLAPLDGDMIEPVVSTGLRESVIARLQNISFFLAGLLVSTLLIQLLWNWLRRDWTLLPRLTYGKALGVVCLWGLLFLLVLTMISGARELMTPGAWEKQGLTNRLVKPKEAAPETESPDKKREEHLMRLRDALWKFAQNHDGHFPDDLAAAGIADDLRHVPDPSAMPYVYVKGLKAGNGDTPLAYEPDIFGPERFVLFTSGIIRPMKADKLQLALSAVTP